MKSTCEERASAIHMLVEGELGPEETRELKAHVAHCAHCAATLQELSRMRSILEASLAAKIALPDKEATVRRAVEAAFRKRSTGAVGRFFKGAAIGVAAGLAAVVLAAAIFARLYFDRTFPDEITGTVMRASGVILAQTDGDAEWRALRPTYPVKPGMRIKLAQEGQSVLSFDGVKILAKSPARITVMGTRSLSLDEGSVAVASADKRKPLKIAIGDNSIESNGSTLRLSAYETSFSVDCIAGGADVTIPGSANRQITSGQRVTISGDNVLVVSAPMENPFEAARESVLARIRRRFDRVMARYAFAYPDPSGHLGNGPQWQFASYSERRGPRVARGNDLLSVADYYEKLFSPSNRTISIGRQRVVPVTPGYAASQPSWSHDGSMISFIESTPYSYQGRLRIVRLDDLDHPWDISQEYEGLVVPMLPAVWAPDNEHVIFSAMNDNPRGFNQNYQLKIAPIDPAEGPIRDFNSPFYDIPLPLPIPIGKNFSPNILTLPWGDAMVVGNWGNLGYVPVEPDGQAVAGAPGFFLTNFNPREFFTMGGGFSPSGSTVSFSAFRDLQFNPLGCYLLYDVEDILDGFAQPPRSPDDLRVKHLAPSENMQFGAGFSYDESLVFFHEDVNNAFDVMFPIDIFDSDFDLFYANALPGEPGTPTQIHLPGSQMFVGVSPEGNRVVYCNYDGDDMELRVVAFDVEADMDTDLGGVLIDNSGTNLIVPPGTLEENFTVRISTPFSVGEEAELTEGDKAFFAMRLIDAEGLENPKFIEPMTLTIRYTDKEVEGLDEGMIDIYYYDESDPGNPGWIALGGTVDTEHNEVTVEIRHFSKFSIGGTIPGDEPPVRFRPPQRATRAPADGVRHGTQAAGPPVDTSTIVVVAGVGFDDISLIDPACSREFVKSTLGPPQAEMDRFLDYETQYRMNFFFSRGGGRLTEIRLNRGFKGQLSSGISLSSTMEEVFDMYGEPTAVVNSDNLNTYTGDRMLTKNGKFGKIYYNDQGLLFWFHGNHINQIVTFKKS